jgi:Ca-activated chloride channel family protein
MTGLRMADPWLLLSALSVLGILWLRIRLASRGRASFRYPSLELLTGAGRSLAVRLAWLPFALRLAALVLLVVAFARPQAGHAQEEFLTRGIDIVLVLDNSTSMAAEDFRPRNRLAVAKEAVAAFIEGRRSDRIGLVVFAGRGYTACPLTLDYDVLLEILAGTFLAERDEGTAIGMGMAMALNRLRDSDARSKVVVLLTDGRNNRGAIDPSTAASLAATLGIRVYAIGVGARGEAPFPVQDPILGKRYVYLRADIDENTLRSIATSTGGRYFRATDRESLHQILVEIDALEKTEIKVKHYTHYSELFPLIAWPAFGLLMVEMVLASTRLRRLP